MHRFPFYPGSGEASEVGSGDGLGTTVNLPIQLGTSRELQRKAFRLSLEKFARKIRPELIIIKPLVLMVTTLILSGLLGWRVKIMLSSRKLSWTSRVCTLLGVS